MSVIEADSYIQPYNYPRMVDYQTLVAETSYSIVAHVQGE
jgi:hypothetical protein